MKLEACGILKLDLSLLAGCDTGCQKLAPYIFIYHILCPWWKNNYLSSLLSSLRWVDTGLKNRFSQAIMNHRTCTKRKEQTVPTLPRRLHVRHLGFVLLQMCGHWWFMNGELAGALENSWVGRRDSEDTGVSWSEAINTADILASTYFYTLECLPIILPVGLGRCSFTHIANVWVWGIT